MKYDYLIVGAGFFGATFARLMTDAGKKCLVIDSRNHIGGNSYTHKQNDIDVHTYGPHIFHTNDKDIWNFVNKYAEFNNFVLSPKAISGNKMYSLPFNMNTFYEMWNVTKPKDAKDIIENQKFKDIPTNLEEQALSLVGKDIYETLIKHYTEKQWKKDPKELPSEIIKRLPVRFTYDNNYFNDRYQGIPINGYTDLFDKMLENIDCILNTNYFDDKELYDTLANKIVFTGRIDEYFNYKYGELEYRTLKFDIHTLNEENYQGTAVVNYCDNTVPYTRIIEHKHFAKTTSKKTVISIETPVEWTKNSIPYYPINTEENKKIYDLYRDEAKTLSNVIFGGRLAEYRYYDMHQVIGSAMAKAKLELL